MIIVIYNENTKEFEILPNRLNGNKYIWQYDYGQTLRIQGLHLPSAVEIHFSLQETGGTSVSRVGVTKDGVTDVIIPDSMLENDGATKNYDMFAFVYLTDDTSGQTEYKIKLQVKSRPKPEVPGGGENPDVFHEAVQKVKESADKAAESEKQAEGWAHGREDLPERAQDNAKYYAGQAAADAKKTGADRKEVERLVESVAGIDEQVAKVENLTKQAQTSATNAALSEQAAKTAETNAQTAQAGAETAEGNAELAEQGAKASEQAVERAKQLVTQMGQEVLDNKNHVDQTVQAFTLTAQQALADVNNAGQTQTERVQSAGNTAVESVKTAQGTATQAVETAKVEAVEAVQTEGTTQTGNVTQEGEKQVQAVQAAAQEIVADREQIQQNKEGIEALKQGKADAIVETASGEDIQIEDGSGLGFEGLRVFGKSMQDGVPSPESPVPIVNVGDKGNIILKIDDDAPPQSLTLTTPNGLPGIKVDKDGNYTDKDGQQWVCDEVDLARGKYVQRVGIEKINGGWELSPSPDSPGRFLNTNKFTNVFANALKKSLCNIASFSKWGIPVNDKYAFALNDTAVYFSPPKGSEITVEELNAKLNSLSFSVIFVGELTTPIERDLTHEEIAAYKALHTNYPTTVISNDESAHMEVSYVADTKRYIASKIETPLQKQITDLQNALISQKISGGGIKVTDSARLPIKGFRIFGKSTQDGIPSPGNPVPIANVGNNGNIKCYVSGKNICFLRRKSIRWFRYSTALYVEAELKPNTVYTFSYNPGLAKNSFYINENIAKEFRVFDENRERIIQTFTTKDVLDKNNTEQYSPGYGWIFLKNNKNNVPSEFTNIQIEKNSVATPYVPYTPPQHVVFQTPNGLPGIKVDSGGNYTDKDGQQWISDEITMVERIQRIGRIASYNGEQIDTEYMSSYGELSTGAEVIYVLKEPIVIPLTEEEISMFKEMHTNYPATTILNDENADMELTYTVDTKSYVDTKIAEISKAII